VTRAPLGRTVLALGLVSFFQDVGSEMVFPLLPALLAGLGAGPAFLGLIEGAADAVAALVKYKAGGYSDRARRRKPLLIGGYTLPTIVRPLLALATSPWHVLSVRLADRLGKGIRSAPRDALLAASVPDQDAGRAFGFHRAMDHAGAVVGPLLATVMLTLGADLRTVFLVSVVPGLFAVGFTLLAKDAPAPPASPAAARASAAGPLPPRLKSLLLIFGLFALGNSSDAFLLVRAKEVGLADAALPLLWVALHLSKVFFAWVGGHVADRVRREVPIFLGWAVFAGCYLGLAWAGAPWQVVALFLVYGAFYGLTEPAEKALVRALAPESVRGRAFGLYHGALGAAAIPAGLLTGGLWSVYGHFAALATGAAIAAASALALYLWARSVPAVDLPA
jgi:MFS family permease